MASGAMSPEQFQSFLHTFLCRLTAHLDPGAVVYTFMDWRHMLELQQAAARAGLELINLCVWVKTNGGMGFFYRSQHELVFVFRQPGQQHRNNVQLVLRGSDHALKPLLRPLSDPPSGASFELWVIPTA